MTKWKDCHGCKKIEGIVFQKNLCMGKRGSALDEKKKILISFNLIAMIHTVIGRL